MNLPISLEGSVVITSVRYNKERVSVHVFRIVAALSRQIAWVLRSDGLPDAGAACQRRTNRLVRWLDCLPMNLTNVYRYVLFTLHSPISTLKIILHSAHRCTIKDVFRARLVPFLLGFFPWRTERTIILLQFCTALLFPLECFHKFAQNPLH